MSEEQQQQQQWDSIRCNDRAGFLFSHDCPYPPVNECKQCGRPICDDHTRYNEASEPTCVSCSKAGIASKPIRRIPGRRDSQYDDPYFYSYGHYHGYGYYGPGYWGHSSYHSASHGDDRNFTAGDSEVLAESEDDATFEKDMSES